MKPDKHFFAAACIVVSATALIALTWIGTIRTIDSERQEATARVSATLANQALTFAEQINRQMLALDQTLRGLVTAWQTNPDRFDLQASRSQAVVLSGLSRDMILTDENGVIRQASVSEAVNQNASGLDYFRALSDPSDTGEQMFVGSATIDGIMRQWHMNVARSLHYPDGAFAGVIDADYRIAAITDVFAQTNLGTDVFMTLVGLDDGKLRGAVGPTPADPDAVIADTPMFVAVRNADSGIWTGPSPNDAVPRIHAFRHIPGRNLAVVVALGEEEAMRPATNGRRQAELYAGCISVLLAGVALLLIQATRFGRRRASLIADHRAALAAANAQFEVARAWGTVKSEQLDATLAGLRDGVSMFDAHMCLVEWNARFAEIAAIPPEILRGGMPVEEILRAQISTGQFGPIADAEAEVERRTAHLRSAPAGVTQWERPDGHTLVLRHNRLQDGGFVTIYTDTTEHRQSEDALRRAREAAEAASNEKSRFVAIVSHEIRTPLNALLNTVKLIDEAVLGPTQRALLAMARQSGDALLALMNDILDLSVIEAGKLAIRPQLFELRPLLESSAEMLAREAAERGITIRLSIAPGTPHTLLTDPGRLRQVLLNLLSNAVKYGRLGDVWLTAEPGRGGVEAIRLTVKDDGPVIAPTARERLFRPFSRLDQREGSGAAGTGLGLAICHHLVKLMGGEIGCDVWRSADGRSGGEPTSGDGRSGETRSAKLDSAAGREGNAFWIALPAAVLLFRADPAQSGEEDAPRQALAPIAGQQARIGDRPRRRPPRTRVLLTEDVAAAQHVTAALMRREGHHVAVATSGADAIQAIQAAPYDLVFMDMLMPGMNGQEAARIIRTLPEPARSTPVIALTADVGPDTDVRLQEAGMDGVLGKPVSLAELLDAVERHVWSGHVTSAASAPVAADAAGFKMQLGEESGAKPILAQNRIDVLRLNLPPETFAKLVDECLTDMEHRLPALRRALLAGAPGAVTAHAHALLGLAAGYGMAALEARLRIILTAARDWESTPLGPVFIAELEADFADASSSLRALLRTRELGAFDPLNRS